MRIIVVMATNSFLDKKQKNLLDTVLELSRGSSHEIIFTNNQDEQYDLNDYNYSFIPLNDLETISLDNSVVITPVHHLFVILPHINGVQNVKLCTYCYSTQAFKWLSNNIGSPSAIAGLQEIILKTKACAVIDDSIRFDISLAEECPIIPYIVSMESVCLSETRPLISKTRMNVGFYGRVDSRAANAVLNLLRYYKYQKLGDYVDFYIFGTVDNMSLFKHFKNYNQNSRIIFVGNLDFDALGEYVKNHVDFLLSYGHYALEASFFGVPVAIPAMSKKVEQNNGYVWLSDVSGYVYEWENSRNNDLKTLGTIWDEVTAPSSKECIADCCFEYVLKNASPDIAVCNLRKLIEESSLTPEVLFSNEDIRSFVSSYQQSVQRGAKEKSESLMSSFNPVRETLMKIRGIVGKPYDSMSFTHIQNAYGKKKNSISRIKGKIKVAFFVTFKQSFPSRSIFELMISDKDFDPYIVITPNVSRTMTYQVNLMEDAFDSLSKEYGAERVIKGYDRDTDVYLDFRDEFRIIFFSNPYKHYDHPLHNIDYFLKYNVLTAYINYGFPCLKFWDNVLSLDFYNKVWNVYAETQSHVDYLRDKQVIHSRNVVLTGYSKIDKLSLEKKVSKRKTVILAPHHTVFGWNKLNISNFLKYQELFIKLPVLFEEIDFVFRPHPLLFQQLIEHKIWSEDEIQQYLDKIDQMPNMRYDDSDYYYDSFADSDAMIHDCGSFIAEYLYTKKPCCYMMKSKDETYSSLVPFGQECMDNYYHAYTEEDILRFLSDVVIGGNDPMKTDREAFVDEKLAYNYPHASEAIVSHLKQELGRLK